MVWQPLKHLNGVQGRSGLLLFVFLLNKTLPQKFRAIPAKLLRKKIGLRGRNQRPDTGQSS